MNALIDHEQYFKVNFQREYLKVLSRCSLPYSMLSRELNSYYKSSADGENISPCSYVVCFFLSIPHVVGNLTTYLRQLFCYFQGIFMYKCTIRLFYCFVQLLWLFLSSLYQVFLFFFTHL